MVSLATCCFTIIRKFNCMTPNDRSASCVCIYVVCVFYTDSNRNGLITHSDFKDMLKALQKVRKWTLSDARLSKATEVLNRTWHSLQNAADLDRDQKVNHRYIAYL